MKVCVLTDNIYIFQNFKKIIINKPQKDVEFDFFCSKNNKSFFDKFSDEIKMLDIKNQSPEFYNSYDLFISLHCKQMFPDELVNNHICINVHPGLNPYNRGWFPQVFGIINKKPIGVTIHLMDSEMDHGDILYQKELELFDWETSKDIYNRILEAEMELLGEHFEDILYGKYSPIPMPDEGNLNLKKDFDKLCELDLNETANYGQVIDRLRALTFAPYNNAYFYDKDGNKIYVGITLKKEDN